MECYSPATMLQHAFRTAEAAEVSISIKAVLATLRRAFDAEKVPSLAPTFILSRYHIAEPPSYDLLAFRSRPCRRRGPFYTLVLYYWLPLHIITRISSVGNVNTRLPVAVKPTSMHLLACTSEGPMYGRPLYYSCIIQYDDDKHTVRTT